MSIRLATHTAQSRSRISHAHDHLFVVLFLSLGTMLIKLKDERDLPARQKVVPIDLSVFPHKGALMRVLSLSDSITWEW